MALFLLGIYKNQDKASENSRHRTNCRSLKKSVGKRGSGWRQKF